MVQNISSFMYINKKNLMYALIVVNSPSEHRVQLCVLGCRSCGQVCLHRLDPTY